MKTRLRIQAPLIDAAQTRALAVIADKKLAKNVGHLNVAEIEEVARELSEHAHMLVACAAVWRLLLAEEDRGGIARQLRLGNN